MNHERHPKVKASHLARDAYLYVRQATDVGEVSKHANRLEPRCNLQRQAMALGWPAERVIVIDSDIGQSAASATDRRGFQMLVRQVRKGCVGVVMALDPSRLTRNRTEWHRLLDECEMNDTLVLVYERLYDPAHANDRILLGRHQTMLVRKAAELLPEHTEAVP
jgi:DNA invertase Pin-like site-specific DNA recombinase